MKRSYKECLPINTELISIQKESLLEYLSNLLNFGQFNILKNF